jgi:hypothetical protein
MMIDGGRAHPRAVAARGHREACLLRFQPFTSIAMLGTFKHSQSDGQLRKPTGNFLETNFYFWEDTAESSIPMG